MNTRISDAAVEAAIDAYENAPGVMQFPAMKAALEAYEAHKAEQQGADARAQFEAWVLSTGRTINDLRKVDGDYIYEDTRCSWRAWQAALAARQPVGQVIAHRVHYMDGVTGEEISVSPWMDGDAAEFNVIYAAEQPRTRWIENAYAAPPAQAVDLGQFREAVELLEWVNGGHNNPEWPTGDAAKHADAVRLLALIDGQAGVGRG